jgi:drug/metabolite transporter (DMT)-like permease
MAGIQIVDVLSLVLVGACWGCTNPLLRASSAINTNNGPTAADAASDTNANFAQSVVSSLSKFRRISVWLPYVVNQAGSLLYYFALSQSDLSVAVPVCNALALVFSIATSYFMGERVDQPLRTMLGATLVMGGVAVCLVSRNAEENNDLTDTTTTFEHSQSGGEL